MAEPEAEEEKVVPEVKKQVPEDEEEAMIQTKLEALLPRIPKDWPGEEYKFPVDAPPTEIEFKWNKEIVGKRQCDTLHMLYLLQIALGKVRRRTNDRNKTFQSIKRTDRYIDHLNGAQIITNFLDWHNKDPQKNTFDGDVLHKSQTSQISLIKDYFAHKDIGKMPFGPATNLAMKIKDVYIDNEWTELPQPRLKLKTIGYDRLHKGDKILAECSVEEVVTLLTFVAVEQKGNDGDDEKTPEINGIFAAIEQDVAKKVATGKKPGPLFKEENWKQNIVKFFEDRKVDGKELEEGEIKALTQEIINALIPVTELNAKGKPRNNLLRGGVKSVLNALKTCTKVNAILIAAKQSK